MSNGVPSMGGPLVKWFIFSIVVSVIAGYVASITIGTGAEYMTVHRVTSVVAFAGYALSGVSETIWYKRNCMTTIKNLFDGLIYGLVTGGVFGWLWPSM
jgi:hypothetical protein